MGASMGLMLYSALTQACSEIPCADGVGGLWSANLGFGRREIRDAITAQLDELAFYNTFRGTTHPRAIELSARLVQLMEPDGVRAVLFGNGGSDAVEGALKVARQYWKLQRQSDRTKFIALRQGYHGVHFGGVSVNGNTNFRRAYEPLLPGCFHIDTPWVYRNPYTDDPARLAEICAELLDREIRFQGVGHDCRRGRRREAVVAGARRARRVLR